MLIAEPAKHQGVSPSDQRVNGSPVQWLSADGQTTLNKIFYVVMKYIRQC